MKKVNPRRRPCSEADLNRARNKAVEDAIQFVKTIFFTVLLDKYGWNKEQLAEFRDRYVGLSDEIEEGRISYSDLRQVLKVEYDILV